MKNTTLSENAPNGPALPPGGSAREGAIAPMARLGGAAVLFVIALLGLSVVGGEWTAGRLLEAWRGGSGDPASAERTIELWTQLRLQRLLFAAAIGGVLSLAGVAFQAVLRNPLAEPYILGVSGGASVGVLSAPWWWAVGAGAMVPALAGGLAALGLLLGAARWARVRDSASLILTGAVLNAIFAAWILLLYTLLSGPQAGGSRVEVGLAWAMGNLGPERYRVLGVLPELWLVLGVGAVTLLLLARPLDLLALGEEEAADLGIETRSHRWLILIVGSLITAVAVAAAGPIGFVGLIVPHAVRRLVGVSHRRVIPWSIFGGALFLMLADTFARSLLPGRPLPVGVVTAMLGGPFFILLLRRRGEGDA